MKLEKINHDLFDISKRLKSIDRRYDLFFNRKKNRYEIYANGAMQMALPFERLDARALSYARKTRLENLEKNHCGNRGGKRAVGNGKSK